MGISACKLGREVGRPAGRFAGIFVPLAQLDPIVFGPIIEHVSPQEVCFFVQHEAVNIDFVLLKCGFHEFDVAFRRPSDRRRSGI